jgi:polysaccharide biosynthesis/export protein
MKHCFTSCIVIASAVFGLAVFSRTAIAETDNQLRPRDTISINVTNQPDLSKKYAIEQDGTLMFPLVGRVQAAGLTLDALGKELARRLADGFLTDPQVRVDLDRTGRVFVFGGVSSPGMYQLTERMTLIELLARAGYGTAAEALIIRTKGATAPVLPGDNASSNVIRVNLREFEKDLEAGQLSRNVLLEDGDTIFVPRRDPNRIYVSGQVHSQGAYSITEGTTLLQALALAGGPTERASLGRIRVFRLVDGKQKTIAVKLEDVVRPGDTIFVPERLF